MRNFGFKGLIWTASAIALGVFSAAGVLEVAEAGGRFFERFSYQSAPPSDFAAVSDASAKPAGPVLASSWRIPKTEFYVPEQGKAILVNLQEQKLFLFEEGEPVGKYEVASIGRAGSAWETPVGVYQVKLKEANHFSSIGRVWMPWSLHFYGNFFIHGWPYYPSGQPVASGFSGGCIRLSQEEARAVYDFAGVETPVIIYGSETAPILTAQSYYYWSVKKPLPPDLSAESFLAADLDSGDVLLQKNAEQVLPIASISKLVTALVSLEVVNQFQETRISEEAVSSEGSAGGLRAGETITTAELIYPLLLESSNDAAEALAEHFGRRRFIEKMNEKIQAIGLLSTRFEDPSGLSSGNVSSGSDLFRLARFLYQNKRHILEITSQPAASSPTHHWINNNRFVKSGNSFYLGGKTGYTDEADKTFLGIFSLPLSEFERRQIVIIILGAENREEDAGTILKYLSENIYYGLGSQTQTAGLFAI